MSELNAEEEFSRESETEWLPTGPRLEELTWDEYADLLTEVALIDSDKHEEMGH